MGPVSRPLVFKSRIDTWLLVVLLSAVAVVVLGIDALAGSGAVWRWPLIVVLAAVALLPIWILLQTRYLLYDSELRIACGPFRWSVPIDEISNVVETQSRAASPALSLRRLRIEYGGRAIMIAPSSQDLFLRSLEVRREDAKAG